MLGWGEPFKQILPLGSFPKPATNHSRRVNDCLNELVPRLRTLRQRHDLTQEKAAELMGLGFKFYQAIEAGRKPNLTLETLGKISRAYGLRVSQLLGPEIPATAIKSKKRGDARHKKV